jgi:hypothetical protein
MSFALVKERIVCLFDNTVCIAFLTQNLDGSWYLEGRAKTNPFVILTRADAKVSHRPIDSLFDMSYRCLSACVWHNES